MLNYVMQKRNILQTQFDQSLENPKYLEEQLITYIGNKRSLLDFIGEGIKEVCSRLGKEKLVIFDAFSGSGVVARYLKRYSEKLIVNDLEYYSSIINKCYLSNVAEIDLHELTVIYRELMFELENSDLEGGLITELYSPRNDKKIKRGERVFYTNRNARYIDTARRLIEGINPELQHFFLAPLLSEASIHANTSGVFKGFYKNSDTGLGKFGGKKGDALKRILGDIHLQFPVFSNYSSEIEVHRGDTNKIVESLKNLDITYLDPPYNQHPYGSNYFMLNLISENISPNAISKVSGIPVDWNRSNYNRKNTALVSFEELVKKIDSKYLLISFNSEGFISKVEMLDMLNKYGKVDILETNYNTFRGSRNLRSRDIYVIEYLYLLEKKTT